MKKVPCSHNLIKAVLISTAMLVSGCMSSQYSTRYVKGPATQQGINIQEKNKEDVVAYYQAGLNDKNVDLAMQFISHDYVQHNPNVRDGYDGLKEYLIERRSKNPQAQTTIKAIFADGDYVILHVHTVREPGQRGNAIIDIFKLKDGKIIEHWDAVQSIPEKALNTNTMF